MVGLLTETTQKLFQSCFTRRCYAKSQSTASLDEFMQSYTFSLSGMSMKLIVNSKRFESYEIREEET